MSDKKLDIRIIILLALTVIACPIAYSFRDQFTTGLRAFLESEVLQYIIWAVIFLLYIIHYWRYKRVEVTNSQIVISSILPPFMDNFFGAVTYGIIITTTLTLMKGIFIQIAFDEIYFKDFSQFDIFSLSIALFFMLWYALNKIAEDVEEIFWIERTGEVELNPSQITEAKQIKIEEEK